ncbi:MAG TPA: serine hydrolase [Geminicoccaceae bacterium]|nr:serine hydrolase [Geminicoccus sp.]HMU50837.1 serine hydrolase [Geminicoccaceae bacterium]
MASGDAVVRAAPSGSAQLLGTHRLGMLGTIVDGPVTDQGTTWWKVDYEDTMDGWSPAGRLGGAYFPPRESSGGWRSLTRAGATPSSSQKSEIRAKAGLDWDKLSLAHAYGRSFSSSSSLLVIRNGWVAGEFGSTAAVGVGSVSKSLTALTLAKLFDLSASGSLKRKIGPDDYVHGYVPPEWSKDSRKKQIRFDHMMTMSSGLTPDDRPTQPDYLKLVMSQSVRAAPRREWSYQSAPVDLIGIAMQRLTGKRVRDLFTQHIGSRIGIASLSWDTFADHTRASSGAKMSPRDLARVGHLMMMNGRWGSSSSQSQVVSAGNIAYLRRGPGCVQSADFRATPDSPFLAESSSPQSYGRLWWTNLRGTALGSAVPSDAFFAVGLREKLLIVVPSLDLIVVRIGDAPTTVAEFRRELMKRVMAAVTGPATSYNGPRVASLSLVQAKSGKPITLCDPMPADVVIELDKLPTRDVAFRANMAPSGVGSLHYYLHGPQSERKTSGSAAASWPLSEGPHSLTVTPYAKSNLGGGAGVPLVQHYVIE